MGRAVNGNGCSSFRADAETHRLRHPHSRKKPASSDLVLQGAVDPLPRLPAARPQGSIGGAPVFAHEEVHGGQRGDETHYHATVATTASRIHRLWIHSDPYCATSARDTRFPGSFPTPLPTPRAVRSLHRG